MNEKEFRIELITNYLNLRDNIAKEYNNAINQKNKTKEAEYWSLLTEINNLIMEQSSRFLNHDTKPISNLEIQNEEKLHLKKRI